MPDLVAAVFGDTDPATIALVAAAYLAGGVVKGATGVGLPLVAVPLIALAVPAPVAIATMVLPGLLSNAQLVVQGGGVAETVRRFWPLILCLVAATVLAAQFLTAIDPALATTVLGAMVLLFAVSQLAGLTALPGRLPERWLGPVVGLIAGAIGGVSNFFGPPLIAYLVALRLDKDVFVRSISFIFLFGVTPLYVSLAVEGVIDRAVIALSAVGWLAVVAGMAPGRRIRARVSQRQFLRILAIILVIVGANLVRRGAAGVS